MADDPETLRIRKNMATISNVAYHGDLARKEAMENARPTEVETTRKSPLYTPLTTLFPSGTNVHETFPDGQPWQISCHLAPLFPFLRYCHAYLSPLLCDRAC